MPLPTSPARPRVSVAMITYNHEAFIAQAIESVLGQRTDFPLELVIGEDCSTDGTRAIVERYARLRPDLVRPLLQPRNLGMYENSFAVVRTCRGEFIAFLEGDDYWTDAQKLATQAAVLAADERIALTWHSLMLVDAADKPLHRVPWNREVEAWETMEQLVTNGMPGTAGVMMRRSTLDLEALAEFRRFPQGDYPTWLLACRDGRLAHFDPACRGAYRRHAGGITARFNRPEVMLALAEMWQLLAIRTGMTGLAAIKQQIWQSYHQASRALADQGRWSASMRALAASTRYAAMPLGAGLVEYGKCAARTSARSLAVALRPKAKN